MGLMTNILEEKKKEEGAQRLVLSRKNNLESGPTQANLLDELNQCMEKNKCEETYCNKEKDLETTHHSILY